MRLFKFCGESGVNILGSLQLKLTPPDQFNDPFEFSVVYDCSEITIEDVLLGMDTAQLFNDWRSLERPDDSLKEAKEYYQTHRQELAQKFFQNITVNNREKIERDNKRIAAPWWLIGCFSKNRDSILMWSHYSDQHRGLVIEFETENFPPDVVRESFALDVVYDPENKKPIYKYQVAPSFTDKEIIIMSSVKGLGWQYENESRYVVPSTLLNGQRFMKFDPPAIRSVTLGVESSPQLRSHVENILRHQDFSDIALYGSNMSRTEYKLEFYRISSISNRQPTGEATPPPEAIDLREPRSAQ